MRLPAVVNGFSDVLLEVFGERGRHSRSAVGAAELPFGAPVEVEAEAELLPATSVPVTEEGAAPPTAMDLGLRGADYVGFGPLSIPAEALVRSIRTLSRFFWVSIAGTVVAIFLASLANLLGHADGSVPFGEYRIPLSVLPTACACFAMFMFWLTASRLRMLDGALADDDLTANMARDIFRLDPPVLDVFDAGNLRRFALLSGFSMLLWNWSLFFGISTGLTFSATIVRGAAASVNETTAFTLYGLFALAVGAYGVASIAPPLRRILKRLHGGSLKIGLARIAIAALLFLGGILATSPDLPWVMFYEDDWQPLEPSHANALNGETLLLEGGRVVVLAGIEALRPRQTCLDADGVAYACGTEATMYLQSLVQDKRVLCHLTYPDIAGCAVMEEGAAPPTLRDAYSRSGLAPMMVSAGLAFAEGDGAALLGELQDEAQRRRAGAWRGSFEPPRRWAARQGR